MVLCETTVPCNLQLAGAASIQLQWRATSHVLIARSMHVAILRLQPSSDWFIHQMGHSTNAT